MPTTNDYQLLGESAYEHGYYYIKCSLAINKDGLYEASIREYPQSIAITTELKDEVCHGTDNTQSLPSKPYIFTSSSIMELLKYNWIDIRTDKASGKVESCTRTIEQTGFLLDLINNLVTENKLPEFTGKKLCWRKHRKQEYFYEECFELLVLDDPELIAEVEYWGYFFKNELDRLDSTHIYKYRDGFAISTCNRAFFTGKTLYRLKDAVINTEAPMMDIEMRNLIIEKLDNLMSH